MEHLGQVLEMMQHPNGLHVCAGGSLHCHIAGFYHNYDLYSCLHMKCICNIGKLGLSHWCVILGIRYKF